MIASNFHARRENKRGDLKREYGGIWGEKEEGADYGVIERPSQQDVVPYEKGFEWG